MTNQMTEQWVIYVNREGRALRVAGMVGASPGERAVHVMPVSKHEPLRKAAQDFCDMCDDDDYPGTSIGAVEECQRRVAVLREALRNA